MTDSSGRGPGNIMDASVIWWSDENLEVDTVASLLNGSEELCIVFCLHVVLHHFHLRSLNMGTEDDIFFIKRQDFPNKMDNRAGRFTNLGIVNYGLWVQIHVQRFLVAW